MECENIKLEEKSNFVIYLEGRSKKKTFEVD